MIMSNNSITLKDKEFSIYMDEIKILDRVRELSKKISEDYHDKNPLLIGILNGSFVFASDLVRNISIDTEVSFIKVASYSKTQSTGKVKKLVGLTENVFKRHLIIVEDIVDTGLTMTEILEDFSELGAASIEVATLLLKPDSLKKPLQVKYVGFEIPNKFVVGYGLDYDGLGRNLNHIYQLKE